jgi:hypothetical protein
VKGRIGSVAYQPSISVPLVVPPKKRSMAVFVATLIMRYVPGWVLNGVIAEDVEVAEDVDAEEDVAVEEDVEVAEEEETGLVDCCCWGVGTFLSLCAAESPPPTPPPIAAPNTTSTSANAIQNVRVESPHMRGVDVPGSSLMCAASLVPCWWYPNSSRWTGGTTSRPG